MSYRIWIGSLPCGLTDLREVLDLYEYMLRQTQCALSLGNRRASWLPDRKYHLIHVLDVLQFYPGISRTEQETQTVRCSVKAMDSSRKGWFASARTTGHRCGFDNSWVGAPAYCAMEAQCRDTPPVASKKLAGLLFSL